MCIALRVFCELFRSLVSQKQTLMPFRFEFRVNNIVRFAGNLQCAQCQATNQNGQQCKREVCLNRPYCPQHTRMLLGLEIRPSTIQGAGDGLFTLLNIPADDWIAPMLGQVISDELADARYGDYTGPYLNRVDDAEDETGAILIDALFDGALVRGIGNAANTVFATDGTSNEAGCNCKIFANPNDGNRPWLASTQAIAANSELFAYYGDDYTLDPQVSHVTRRIQ